MYLGPGCPEGKFHNCLFNHICDILPAISIIWPSYDADFTRKLKTCKTTASPWTSWPVTTLLTPLSTCADTYTLISDQAFSQRKDRNLNQWTASGSNCEPWEGQIMFLTPDSPPFDINIVMAIIKSPHYDCIRHLQGGRPVTRHSTLSSGWRLPTPDKGNHKENVFENDSRMPAGVPVRMISPGWRWNNRDNSAIISSTWKVCASDSYCHKLGDKVKDKRRCHQQLPSRSSWQSQSSEQHPH